MKRILFFTAIFGMFLGTGLFGQQSQAWEYSSDYKGVHTAILDYVEGIYLMDTTRIHRSIHPDLRKRGYWFNSEKGAWSGHSDMNFQQLVALTATWNKDGKRANDQSPKIIAIYDINSKTASAKLTAAWGIDYFHLAKLDGKWYIMNVLWQSIREE